MRLRFPLAAALALAGCAAPGPPVGEEAPADPETAPLRLQLHAHEVPRIPHPAYHRDGMQVAWVRGGSAFAKAGLRAGDVIESVNGGSVVCDIDERNFWRLAGTRSPSKVVISGSRLGAYGANLVTLEVTP